VFRFVKLCGKMECIAIIDQVFKSISIHKSIMVCNDMVQVETMMTILQEKCYPCGFRDTDNVRLIMTTEKELQNNDFWWNIKTKDIDVVFFMDRNLAIENIGNVMDRLSANKKYMFVHL